MDNYDEDTLSKLADLPGVKDTKLPEKDELHEAAQTLHERLAMQPGLPHIKAVGMRTETVESLKKAFSVVHAPLCLYRGHEVYDRSPSIRPASRMSPVAAALTIALLIAVISAVPVLVTYLLTRGDVRRDAVKNGAAEYVDGEFKWK